MKSWLYVGARITPINRTPFQWENFRPWKRDFWRALVEGDPKLGRVYVVFDIRKNDRGILFAGLNGFTLYYSAHSFRPVTTVNTDSQIAAMRELMQKARDERRVTVEA